MKKEKITDVLKKGTVLVSDGAWGTFLQQKGLGPGECPELWCLERPADIFDIAKSYILAGADMIKTNSFGANSFKLSHYNLQDKATEINQEAAKISREAAGNNKWVIASVGPTGKILMMGEISEQELYDSFKEQTIALEKGGADAVCIETMSAIDEAEIAITATKENTSLEIICTFTFERTVHGDYRTMMGVSPEDAVKSLTNAGADIIGTNCGNGINRMIEIVKGMRSLDKYIPILVHANAGLPKNINGIDVFPDSPEDMAKQVPELIRVGANIIGGCCGTTPAHICAIKEVINNIRF